MLTNFDSFRFVHGRIKRGLECLGLMKVFLGFGKKLRRVAKFFYYVFLDLTGFCYSWLSIDRRFVFQKIPKPFSL